MTNDVKVTFRGMDPSAWIESDVRRRARKLDLYCPNIMSCRVVVDRPHRHHESGNRFGVRIDLTVPGEEIAVTRVGNVHGSQKDLATREWVKRLDVEAVRKDLRLVIREAFDIARRRLQDVVRRQRLDVKRHEGPLQGRVVAWNGTARAGRIEAGDGHDVYFHAHSVIGGSAKRLRVGARVTFVEERGDKGPQASTVKLARPQRRRSASTPTPPPGAVSVGGFGA